ncbi:MAG: PAS domain S-box protein, partial [Proteobacteria bacterium]|nr:PAS domain S-box protein [Pseudomonadota bacterium]
MSNLSKVVTRWLSRLDGRIAGVTPCRATDPETQFRRLAEESLQGILVHDGRRRLFANRAYARMFGYPDVAAVLAAETVGQHVVPAEDLPALEAEWRRILAGQQTWLRQRHRRCRLDGSLMWVDLHLGPIVWEGRPAIHGIQIDVTREVEAEAELQRSEVRFRRLAEESLQGIVIHDGRRRLFVNQAYARMMGYADVASALGDHVMSHVPHHQHPAVAEAWRQTLASEHTWARHRVRRQRVDGTLLWLDLMRGPIVWDGRPAVQVIQVDVTREIEAEAELRRNEQRFRAVIDNLPVALTLKDVDRRFSIVNQKFEHWTGVSAAHAIGRTREEITDGLALAPPVEAQVRADEDAVIDTGRAVTCERQQVNAAGERRTLMITKFPMCSAAGRVDSIGTIATDITELKDTQARLERRETELRRNQAVILQVLRDELADGSMPDRIRRILRLAGETLAVNCAAVWRTDRDGVALRCVERWRAPTTRYPETDFPSVIPLADAPELIAALNHQFVLAVDDDHADPRLASFVDTHYRAVNLSASLFAVIRLPDDSHGHVGFGSLDAPRTWSVEDQSFASSIAELIRACFFQDELERRELALQRSEARLRAVVDNLPLVLTLKDTQRRFHIVNQEFERFHGVAAAQAIGRTPEELAPSDGAALAALIEPEVRAEELEVITTGRTVTRERRRVTNAGEYRDIIATKFAVRDTAGAIDGVGTIVTDVTALKQAQSQLVRREAELRRNQAALLQVLRDEDSGASLTDRVRRTIRLAGETLGVDAVAVWRRDPNATVLYAMERWYAPDRPHADAAFPTVLPLADVEPLYRALAERIVVAVDADHAHPGLLGVLQDHYRAANVTATLAALIRQPDGQQVHVGFGHCDTPRVWSAEDESFARSIAELIRVWFFQDALESREGALRRNQVAILQVLRDELSSGSTSDRIKRIVALAGETLGVDSTALWRIDRAAGVVRCVERWRRPGLRFAASDFPTEIPLADVQEFYSTLQQHIVLALDDHRSDRRFGVFLGKHWGRVGISASLAAMIQLP